MLHQHRSMLHDKGKHRGKAVVVDGDTPSHSGSQPAPRKLTAVACVDCRKRKRKCNGQRPSCSACQTRGLKCAYDVVEGATRTEDLKQKVQSLSGRTQSLETFINRLRYSTDNEASAILAQLRLGDSIDVILGTDVNNDNLSDMSEVEQWRDRRRSREQAPPPRKAVSTYGVGLARNPGAPSLLTSFPQYQSTGSERSVSVTTNSPSMVDGAGRDASLTPRDRPESPWAPPLFVEVDSQHVLFEDDPYSEVPNNTHDSFPVLDGDTPNSVYLMGPRDRMWIDPSLDAATPNSAVKLRHAKLLDKYLARRQLIDESCPGGDSITVSSHLFSGIGNVPLSASIHMQSPAIQDLTAPAWSITSMYRTDDPDMMSHVYIEFINESKRLIANGMPPQRVFGLAPDVEALTNEAAFLSATDLSRWTARLANSFGISSLVCRMAVMWVQWHLMRWIIHPTPETYLAIPDWYRPTPYQMFVPHPVYADFHIWPRFRDIVIQRIDLQCQQKYWYSEAGTTLDCNWTGHIHEAVCYDAAGKVTLFPAFINHIMDLGNWTIGPVIRKHVPNADTVLQIKYGPM